MLRSGSAAEREGRLSLADVAGAQDGSWQTPRDSDLPRGD
jgi:hypothetical protein